MGRRLPVLLCALVLAAACSEPPQKEIDRAQGAIDAARAAGAEQYASEAFTDATTALEQAHEAVQQRDYRLALARATDAGERAQDAARLAAGGLAAARSRSEATASATTNAFQQLQARIKAAETAKVAARDLAPVRNAGAAIESTLQKARAQILDGKYLEASDTLKNVRAEIEAQIRAVDRFIEARATRPARASRRR